MIRNKIKKYFEKKVMNFVITAFHNVFSKIVIAENSLHIFYHNVKMLILDTKSNMPPIMCNTCHTDKRKIYVTRRLDDLDMISDRQIGNVTL